MSMASCRGIVDQEFFADSLLFQSPDPKELPLPVYDDFGRFKDCLWNTYAPTARTLQLEARPGGDDTAPNASK